MPVSVQYDSDGMISGQVRYPSSKQAPIMPDGKFQTIFASDDEEVLELNIAKHKMNAERTGFVAKVKTDFENLRQTSLKNLIEMTDEEFSDATKEIRTFELRDGEYVKKVV